MSALPRINTITPQEVSDTLRESPDFLSEAIGDCDHKALHAAWAGRDAMEVLRLIDKAVDAYEAHLLRDAGRPTRGDRGLDFLMRAYGKPPVAAISNHDFVLGEFNKILGGVK